MTKMTSRSLNQKEIKDLKILLQFTSIYCKANHVEDKDEMVIAVDELKRLPLKKHPVCNECKSFLEYAFERRIYCPLDEKPACKDCLVHCFKPLYRKKAQEIMKFSGLYLIRRGRLDMVWRYFF